MSPDSLATNSGKPDDFVNPVRQALDANLITDANGKAAIPVTLPAIPKTARPLEADVIVKLRETGGRTIERKITLPVDLKLPRIGIKPLFEKTVAGRCRRRVRNRAA